MTAKDAQDSLLAEQILSRFFSRVEPRDHADVYAIRHLPQEIQATLNGLYSRSRLSMRETFLRRLRQGLEQQGKTLADLPLGEGRSDEEVLSQVLTEKAGSFLRTYAIDHGHNSLREGAVLHLAIENVSQLVTRFLQRERRASFEESSTRYISFSKEGQWRDPEVMAAGGEWRQAYERALEESFALYVESTEQIREHLLETRPCPDGEDAKAWARAAKAEAFDSARYLLTPALHTKFGLVADARTISDMVTQLCSHPLQEFQLVGERIKEAAETEIPTLLTHAGKNRYLASSLETERALASELLAGPNESEDPIREGSLEVRLLQAPEELDARILASCLYEETDRPYHEILDRIRALSSSEMATTFEQVLSSRGTRDAVPEGMEGGGTLDFEVILDFGAYRDIGRHRKGFQQQQRLQTDLGYAVPPLFDEAGLGQRYRETMQSVGRKARKVAERFPFAAGYLIPFAYLQRVRLCFDVRQMAYFVELRSAPEGHFSYRRIAILMGDALAEVAPLYARYVKTCREEVLLGRVQSEREKDERRRGREERARQLGFET